MKKSVLQSLTYQHTIFHSLESEWIEIDTKIKYVIVLITADNLTHSKLWEP